METLRKGPPLETPVQFRSLLMLTIFQSEGRPQVRFTISPSWLRFSHEIPVLLFLELYRVSTLDLVGIPNG